MEQHSAQIFSDNWNIFQKIIQNDYMHHSEFAAETAAVLNDFQGKWLHMLDIGCGDAAALLTVMRNVNVASYTGYDLSSAMLELAKAHLDAQHIPSVLRQGDMMQLIQSEDKQFDVIYSSFAIHHLPDKEKRKLLQACLARLVPGGKMIYIDIFRSQQMGNEQYIHDYFSLMRNDWSALSENEKQLVMDHVGQYDFPSDIEMSVEWLQFLGFSLEARVQPDRYHAMLVLTNE